MDAHEEIFQTMPDLLVVAEDRTRTVDDNRLFLGTVRLVDVP